MRIRDVVSAPPLRTGSILWQGTTRAFTVVCRVTDPDHSHARTRLVVEALVADDNLELSFFNDEKMPSVRFHEGHDNHLHCRFKA